MPPHHPSCGEEWTTTASMPDPKTQVKPTSTSGFSVGEIEFDQNMRYNTRKNHKNYASGYYNCYQLWDGTSWATEKNLHTDQARTAYRMNYNQPKPFHKESYVNTHGRMKQKPKIFDVKEHDPQANWKTVLAHTQVLPQRNPKARPQTSYLDRLRTKI